MSMLKFTKVKQWQATFLPPLSEHNFSSSMRGSAGLFSVRRDMLQANVWSVDYGPPERIQKLMHFVKTYMRMRLDSETGVLLPSSKLQSQCLCCLGAASYLLGASWPVLKRLGRVLGGFRRLLGAPKLHLGAILNLLVSIFATQLSRFGSGISPKGHFKGCLERKHHHQLKVAEVVLGSG